MLVRSLGGRASYCSTDGLASSSSPSASGMRGVFSLLVLALLAVRAVSRPSNTTTASSPSLRVGKARPQPTRTSTLFSAASPLLPFASPSNGTDIVTHPIALIKCANQTQCIQPYLQLKRTFDIYYCKHVGHGVRFYFLVKQGLLLHPNLRFVAVGNRAE